MKRLIMIAAALAIVAASVAPGHAFIDYLFGGSQTRNAIGNSALGDLRAWWTGNPAYQFNPYYSGGTNPAQSVSGMSKAQSMQGSFRPGAMQQQGNYQPQPQPNVTYHPQQSAQQYGYGQPQAQYQGQPIYGAAGASLPYKGPPQTYQQPVQQYQQLPQQQYQQVPQQYQYQQPVQQQYQPAQRQYQYPAGYPNR